MYRSTRPARTLAFVVASLLIASPAWAAITVEPDEISLKSPAEVVSLRMTSDGTPLTAADIHGWKLEANGFNYSNLVDVTNNDGVLELVFTSLNTPANFVFSVETSKGTVVVPITASLSDDATQVKQRAALIEAANYKIQQRFGGTVVLPQADQPLEVLPTYYEGQSVGLTIPSSATDTVSWFVNGLMVAEGVGTNQFSYSFPEAGYYIITCLVWHVEGNQNVITTRASAQTQVVPYTPVVDAATLNVPATFRGPAGYQQYLWRVDGIASGDAPNLIYTFTTPGTHTVECMASGPVDGVTDQFVRIAFNVVVTP